MNLLKNKAQSSALLLLNKPENLTSFDCIRALKKAWKRTDLGHGGTLDKFATGLLPIFMGEGLKLARFFLEAHPGLSSYWKTYEGVIQLGYQTSTGDPEGEIIDRKEIPSLSVSSIQEVMTEFTQRLLLQKPPIYSAKKIQGVRASEMARDGLIPEIKEVSIFIQSFQCLSFDGEKNQIHFRAQVSKGTYIRVLAQDLSIKLGTVGSLIQLQRTKTACWDLSMAKTLEEALAQNMEEICLSLEEATSFLPGFSITDFECSHLQQGRTTDVNARLANSGLPANAYCAFLESTPEAKIPVALLQLSDQNKATLLRSF